MSIETKRDGITLTRREARDLTRAIEIISETAYRRGYVQGFVQHLRDHYAGQVPTLLPLLEWRASPVRRTLTLPPESSDTPAEEPWPARKSWETIASRMTHDMLRPVRTSNQLSRNSGDVVADFIHQINGGSP